MDFVEVLRTAIFALRGNWMRSALTSLGVIIGIAAVIVMVSVGQGTQSEIDKLVSGLGSNRLDIGSNAGRGPGGVRMSASSFYTITEDDAEAIREEIPEVQYVAATLRGSAQLVYAENNWSATWYGVQPDYFALESWSLDAGAEFDGGDYGGSSKSVILGETVRRSLFGDEDAIGQSIRVGRVPFTVVGVLAPKGQGGFGQDQDDVILVPLETARRRLMGAMALPPGADDDFRVRNIAEIVATRTQTTRLMSLLLAAVATISLVVGGIGIMNIMLVSVTERIREIGLRMAVGAGPSDIRRQFLAEAMLISLIGGVLGIAIGVAGALLVGRFGSLPVVLNAQVVGLAAGFSIATGLFFGYYPARKASLLDPIEALRQQ